MIPVPDDFEPIVRAHSLEELHLACGKLTRELGFNHFLYGVRVLISPTRPYQFIFSGYPKDWWSRYEEMGYERVDPLVQHSVSRVVPLVWDESAFVAPSAARMMSEAHDFGLASGATLPVHSTGAVGLLSLAGDRSPTRARNDILAHLGTMQLFACYLHESVQRLALRGSVLPTKLPQLTPREKECLSWAADGKTTWEIAKILKLSERTIDFHIGNASSKMGVANRRQAVARAVSLGLVNP